MKDLIRFLLNEIFGIWRYRWTAITVAWVFSVLGWLVVYSMPNIYEARTQVYIDAQSHLASVMARVGATTTTGSRVFLVRQALLAREQLEKVIREVGLDSGIETAEEMEYLLFQLGDDIGVSTGRSSESRNLFSISYTHSDRDTAIKVVEVLLNIFIHDVLELREEDGDLVTDYLTDQLAHYSRLLSDSEIKLAEFKKKYVGLLPGESGGIFERLQEHMVRRSNFATRLQIEIDRREELRRQLGGETPSLPEGNDGRLGTSAPSTPVEESIQNNERRKAELLLVYTDRHPDIVAIDEQLGQLYAQRAANRAALAQTDSGIEGVSNATNPVYQSVQIALNESKVLIAGYSSQITQIDEALRLLQNQVDTIPTVEAEFAQLTRDYDQFRGLYSELLVQKERSRLGTAGAERDTIDFNIIEPPAADSTPVSPRRTLLLIGVLIFGLGLGVSFAFVAHQLNPVFMDVQTLRRVTGRPVLGAVSLTWLNRARFGRVFERTAFVLSATALLVFFVLIIALQDIGIVILQNVYASSAS